jgi:uncharacterized protein
MTKTVNCRIPSPEECNELMIRYSMRPNIIEHSRQVMRVTMIITDNLKNGVGINKELVRAAALLHDITKTRSLTTKEPHDKSGGELLRDLGFPDIADIVEQHVILHDFDPLDRLAEREIVYYADKRVLHDRIVSLQERVDDLIARYGRSEEVRKRILQNWIQAISVEKKIAGLMTIDIEKLDKLPVLRL